jgi:hypothetical protein
MRQALAIGYTVTLVLCQTTALPTHIITCWAGGKWQSCLRQYREQGDENDPMFRTVNQCLNGYVHNRSRENLVPIRAGLQFTEFNYPVVVCSDFSKFARTNVADSDNSLDPTELKENFLLEVNYAYLSRLNATSATREYFLIDVLEFAGLDGFVTSLTSEVDAAIEMVGDN